MSSNKETVRKDHDAGMLSNTYITQLADGTSVHRWYDPHTRSWVIQHMDAQENQIGSSTYVGTQREAKAAVAHWVKETAS